MDSQKPDEPRPLTVGERAVLSALLAVPFPGRDALTAQATSAKARQIDQNGSLELVVRTGPRAAVVRRVAVEAEIADADGTRVHVLLHVVEGVMKELEIYRDDGKRVLQPIDTDRLEILVLE